MEILLDLKIRKKLKCSRKGLETSDRLIKINKK